MFIIAYTIFQNRVAMEKLNFNELPDTDFLSSFNNSSPEPSTPSAPPPQPPLARKPQSPSAKSC